MKRRRIFLFHPHVPAAAFRRVAEVLKTRWIGQGPRVDAFEAAFRRRFNPRGAAVAVGSGTDALHLAYILAGIRRGDEVVAPVFTCVATNIPLLYLGAKIRFADVDPSTLNVSPDSVRRLVNARTKAIVCVHYGGLACDMDAIRAVARGRGIPVIEDAAHALGASYKGRPIGALSEFTAFSFQAVKHVTTGDGGMLALKSRALARKAARLRWFGIDRPAKHLGLWDNEIREVGYKYQMTDLGAALGLAGLGDLDMILERRRALRAAYVEGLAEIDGIRIVGAAAGHAAWLMTVLAERRKDLERKLESHWIECGQVHYRNDRYEVFGGRSRACPNMDALENRYTALPLHTRMSLSDVRRVCGIIRSGW